MPKSRISRRVSEMGEEAVFGVLAKAKQLESQGKRIVHLEIGEADFETPQHIKDAAVDALLRGETRYTPTPGLPELRQAIAERLKIDRGVDVDWMKNIVVTVGAKEALFASILTAIDEGDHVVYPNPGFPTYEHAIRYAGGIPVAAKLSEDNLFTMTPENIQKLITPRTRAVIINSPQNPCGSVMSKTDMQKILELADQHDLYIITDEIYSSIIFDDLNHQSPFNATSNLDKVILIDGFSKRYAMTGWRLGYAAAPSDVCKGMIKLLNNMTSCPSSFIQYGGIAALRGPQEAVQMMRKELEARRDQIYQAFKEVPSVSAVKPQGAFYLFVKVSEVLDRLGMTSEQFVQHLLDRFGVAVLHGSAMGKHGEGYIRISFGASSKTIIEGVERVKSAIT